MSRTDGPGHWLPERIRLQLRALAWGWTVAALLVLVLLAVLVGTPHEPESGGVGRALEDLIGGALVLAVLGSLAVSVYRPLTAAVSLAVCGVLLGVYASIQHAPVLQLSLAATFLLPATLLFLSLPRRPSLRLDVLAIALLVGLPWLGYLAAWQVHTYFVGPAHPTSPLTAAPVTTVHWVWAGATTDRSFTVTAKLARPTDRVRLLVREDGSSEPPAVTAVAGSFAAGMVARLTADDLDPGRRYSYEVEVGGVTDPTRSGTVTTFPTGAADFTIAFGACASTGSNGAVFDTIRELDPLAFLHLGDLHYADLQTDDDSARRSTMDAALNAPAQAALRRSTTTAYVWDDHDFLGDNADGPSTAAGSALRVYREYVPHYPLELGEGGPVAQAFTIGRVRFLVTDNRSGRAADAGNGPPSMLGPAQRAWFERQLRDAAGRYAAVVWVNGVPWIQREDPEADAWGGFADERRALADALAAPGVPPVMVLSGDAHMLAIDDGSNSDYTTDGSGGFPVFHAAALDRRGSVRGGPYSHGTFPGPGQFGVMRVHDDGSRLAVEWTGHDWTGRTVVEHRFQVP